MMWSTEMNNAPPVGRDVTRMLVKLGMWNDRLCPAPGKKMDSDDSEKEQIVLVIPYQTSYPHTL